MQLTTHAKIRMQQRGIPPLTLELLDQYGSTKYDKHGARTRYFDKRGRKLLLRDFGSRFVNGLSKQLSTYMVVSEDVVITTGHRYKRLKNY